MARTYTFQKVDGSKTSPFDFKEITFWTQDAEGKVTSTVARSFTFDNAEDLSFAGGSVTDLSISDDEISFVASNDDISGSGVFVTFRLTLEDTRARARRGRPGTRRDGG